MKLPSEEHFNLKPCVISGDDCIIITPKNMGCVWTDENARFRSCIVRKSDNKVISQGYFKFVNFFETRQFQPWCESWPVVARYKYDGSLIILSSYKGEQIVRTRGVSDILTQDTGKEVVDLINGKYSKMLDNHYYKSEQYTILMEHTSPSRIIVLREHEEPTLTLLGIIRNSDATLISQFLCDELAKDWDIGRPQEFKYNSISECLKDVEAWEGREGVVLYSPDGQTLKKIKSSLYLELHRCSTGITNINHVLDVFMSSPKYDDFNSFYNYVFVTMGYESAEKCKDYSNDITDAYLKVVQHIEQIRVNLSKNVRFLETRKDQAGQIQLTYKHSGIYMSIAFKILDNQKIDDNMLRKAIEKELNLND